MRYALCHEFIQLTFEGGEVYTLVGRRTESTEELFKPSLALPIGINILSTSPH
jgi:hypothetical protein